MKEEGVKKVNMSILETEIDLITSIKNDFAIFENSSDLPVLDYPSRLEMGMMAICLRGTTRMSIDLKEYTFGANDMVIVLADQIVQQHQRSDDFLCCVFAVSIKFAQEAILSYRQFLPTLLRIKEDPRILLKPEEVVSVLEYCSFLRQRVNMRDNCFRREIAKSLFHALFYELGNIMNRHAPAVGRQVKTRRDEVFEQFMHLLRDHYKAQRSVTFYADKLCLTPKHLSNVVKGLTGKIGRRVDRRLCDSRSQGLAEIDHFDDPASVRSAEFREPVFFRQIFQAAYRSLSDPVPADVGGMPLKISGPIGPDIF